MRKLPRWILDGVVIGIVNGQDFVDEKYEFMKNLGLPMAGIWMQDWAGQKDFPEGTRVLWNWQLNRDHYYDWDSMVDLWQKDNVKPFVYINPYIADLSSVESIRHHLFQEGVENGFFVKNLDGQPYLINSFSIKFAMIDLTNPQAYQWTKDIIKEYMVKEAKAGGWMHDFGEYLPLDSVLFDGSDPVEYHNRYPGDWAKVVREALDEIPGGD